MAVFAVGICVAASARTGSVAALQHAVQGIFPPAGRLLAMAGYTTLFGYLGIRTFRWE